MLSASDRDADLMRRSVTDGGAPTASQEAWRGGWMKTWKFVRSTPASQTFPCAALLSLSVSSEQDDLDWNSYLMLLQESVQIVFLLSNTLLIDSFFGILFILCHAELKAFVCISVFFSVSSGPSAYLNYIFASSVLARWGVSNKLWWKEWIKAFHVIGCGCSKSENAVGSMWALVNFFDF